MIGSGVTVHNLRLVNWDQDRPEQWAVQFDDWLIKKLEHGDQESLFHYRAIAPHASSAVPRPEHFVPFFIALGSGEGGAKVIYRDYEFGTLSFLCLEF